MEVTDCHCDLDCVKLRSLLGEASGVSQVHKEFTTSHETHDKEDLGLSLEHIVHSHKEGVIGLHEDLLFELGALHLIVIEDRILPERLHCEDLLGVFLLDEEHLTKAATANDLPNDKVL